jgi:hypothetical protein
MGLVVNCEPVMVDQSSVSSEKTFSHAGFLFAVPSSVIPYSFSIRPPLLWHVQLGMRL